MKRACLAAILCLSSVVALGFGSPPEPVQHKEPNLHQTLIRLGYVLQDTSALKDSTASQWVDLTAPSLDASVISTTVTLAASDDRLPEEPAVSCRIDYRVGKGKMAAKDQVVKLSTRMLVFDLEMNEVSRSSGSESQVTIAAGQPTTCSFESGLQLKQTLAPGWLVWVVLIEDQDTAKPLKVLSYHASRLTLLK